MQQRGGSGNMLGGVALHDSFLVREGRVLGIDRHLARLAAAAGAASEELLPAYRSMLQEALDSPGWTFPLVTVEHGSIAYRLRAVEPDALREDAVLWTSDAPDPRRHPELKGPDFPAQRALREQAGRHGADEAVICDDRGRVREGAFSSIVHWRDGALVQAPHGGRLPSITEAAVVHAARAVGIDVVYEASSPASMRDADEVWCLSSLHGIRVVTSWDGVDVSQSQIAPEFRRHLREMEQDVERWIASAEAAGCAAAEGTWE